MTPGDQTVAAFSQQTQQPSYANEANGKPGQREFVDVEEEERRKRYLTFNKDQASSHVKSLKEELFQQQQQQLSSNNNKLKYHQSSSSAAAKARIEQQKSKRTTPCDDGGGLPHQPIANQQRHFVSARNQTETRKDLERTTSDNQQQQRPVICATSPSSPPSNANASANKPTTTRPKHLERLSKLPQQQPNLGRVFPSPRNSVQQENQLGQQELSLGGDQLACSKSKSGPLYSGNNNQLNYRQQPVCEAFIMTGQSMMKLSSNETDQSNNANSHGHKATPTSMNHSSSNSNNNTTNNNNNNNNDLVREQRGKSVSLNRLDSGGESRNVRSFSIDSTGHLVDTTNTLGSGHQIGQLFCDPNDMPARRRAFIAGVSPDDCRPRQSHELASMLWSQRQQQLAAAEEEEAVAASRLPAEEGRREADDCGASDRHSQRHAPAKNVAQPNNGLARELHGPQHQQQQQQPQQQHNHRQSNPIHLQNATAPIADQNSHQTHISGSPIASKPMDQIDTPDQMVGLKKDQEVAISANSNQSSPNQASELVDRESARRLAKRLYNLSGFKRSDVCHHLVKNNPFSQMVAEEYLKLFDFRSMNLDAALRKFLSKLQLNGETQERERILGQFSQRYFECNKNEKFPTSDIVQTLVCAIILLNTDLHGNHPDRKSSKRGGSKRARLSLDAWCDGLKSSLRAQCGNGQSANLVGQFVASSPGGNLNPTIPMSGQNPSAPSNYSFPRHLLVDLYESIKKRPLKCGDDKCDMTSFEVELDKIYKQQFGCSNNGGRSNTLPSRRFAPGSNAPSSTLGATSRRQLKQGLSKLNGLCDGQMEGDFSIEFKSGFLFRKRIFEAQAKPTAKGRRGWRRVYVILQDLRLIMRYNYEPPQQQLQQQHGDQDTFESNENVNKKQQAAVKQRQKQLIAQDMRNTLRLHHSSAKRSANYTKREFVFHLRLADQTELLLQATSEREMNLWIDTINFASACLSSPALPSAVSNSKRYQLRRQRAILPASYTKLSYWEQLIDHEERLQRFRQELEELVGEAPQTKNADKRVKSDFIERMAHLKQETERYNVYVELMRKKSNSPEAIVLSKHPQIASLTPSDEMIKSLPSFAPPQKLEESPAGEDEKSAEEMEAS